MQTGKTIILIAGPTAVGKTAFAVKLATALSTEIISADSRQCFRELNIGVAKPSKEELESVKHYFVNSHTIHDEVNAAAFERYALDRAAVIFSKKDHAIMVGGTGMYIKAFCEGLDDIPAIDPAIRKQVMDDYNLNGFAWLQQQVQKEDELFWDNGEQENPQRLMRALEVIRSTGQSILLFRKGIKKERPFNILKIGLELPREELYDHINTRVEMMMEAGLEGEVKSLIPVQHLNALQTVGYTELFNFFNNKITLAQAVDEIKKNTRHYAKRQLTWFKRDEDIKWFHPDSYESIFQLIKKP
ncbi:MAG: miaA [Chitinophagaceae bacterium]|nr:miaA [Chitinophagaceae bacterium]